MKGKSLHTVLLTAVALGSTNRGDSMITVRSAAERAFGKIPEGATIHIGAFDCYEERDASECIELRYFMKDAPYCGGNGACFKPDELNGSGEWLVAEWVPIGPDISNEPCIPFFREIFGKRFDAAVKELEDEGSGTSELEDIPGVQELLDENANSITLLVLDAVSDMIAKLRKEFVVQAGTENQGDQQLNDQ